MRALGLAAHPQAQAWLAECRKAEQDISFEILGDNTPAIELFLFCQTQWIVGGLGTRIGLNYTPIRGVAKDRGYRRKQRADLLWRVREIELAALAEWSRQSAREADRG